MRKRLTALLFLTLLPSCSKPETSFRQLQPGVRFAQITLDDSGPGGQTTLWIYLPDGNHAPASLPCLFIAPAGTNCITGIDLSDGDRAEHLPYVQAGFAVVAYSLDGPAPDNRLSLPALAKSVSAFRSARAGVDNAKSAVNYALANLPQIDPKRLFTAGHSSAANVAILAACADPRIRAAVAYAPATDLSARLSMIADPLDRTLPGTHDFIRQANPASHLAELSCPLFLFHAEDDDNVPPDSSRQLARDLQAAQKPVTLKLVPTGGHYDPMLSQGIPAAITWLRTKN